MILGSAAVAVVLCIVVKFVYNLLFKEERDQAGYEEGWFGRGPRPDNTNSTDTSIQPFKIHVPDEVLTDLQNRLQRARFEPPLEDAEFLYGFNSNRLRFVIEYWKTEFDWRKQEEQLDKYPNFKTCIEGIDVHFVHVKPALPEGKKLEVIPILICHGWLASFYEFYKLIPLLTAVSDDKNFVFQVVCPSIPGYGFSELPKQKGFNLRATARIFITLMERLGHMKFYVHGGDLGSVVSLFLGKFYPDRIIGVHLSYSNSTEEWDLLKEVGIAIGCAVADSPVALAAYILEKFNFWADRDNCSAPVGNLNKKFTLDELLTNIMIFWVKNNFSSSVRYCKENEGDRDHEKKDLTIPSGLAVFSNQNPDYFPVYLSPDYLTEEVLNTFMPCEAHFAAFEEPKLLAEDIWKFVAIVQELE